MQIFLIWNGLRSRPTDRRIAEYSANALQKKSVCFMKGIGEIRVHIQHSTEVALRIENRNHNFRTGAA